MRVLLGLLLIGIAGCGGEETSSGDVATRSSPVAAADQKATAKKSVGGREPLTLKGHSNWVNSVSFSPDGKRIVSGSWDISSLDTLK